MRDALAKSGRPIVFSICEWGSTKPWLWAGPVGNLWRTTGDIINKWDGKEKWGGNGVVQILDLEDGLESYAGPGHWNDPDMLEVGNGVLNMTESRAHFSMWCILAAPLMAGNDIRSMTPEVRDILTNAEAIAIDQDPLGQQGKRVRKSNGLEVWSKQLADGGRLLDGNRLSRYAGGFDPGHLGPQGPGFFERQSIGFRPKSRRCPPAH
jgi:alpha-galactosidase